MAIGKGDTKQPTFKGQFLMAMPGLSDPNFFQTVTCICEHNSDGAVGIVINRIHPSLSGKDIFEELKIKHNKKTELIPVHIGGPVHEMSSDKNKARLDTAIEKFKKGNSFNKELID